MDAPKPPSAWSLVLVPALITLVVTILRLVGELQGWNDGLFSNDAPGADDAKPGWVGISWLMPIFGVWFGFRLARAHNEPPHIGKTLAAALVASAVLVGGILGLRETGLVFMPSEETPGEPSGLAYALPVVALAMLVGIAAWWRLGLVLLLYALLARLPVLGVTYLAVQNNWNTHYTKLPVGTVLDPASDPLLFLAMPQITFWPTVTVLTGVLFGCLGAALGKRRQ